MSSASGQSRQAFFRQRYIKIYSKLLRQGSFNVQSSPKATVFLLSLDEDVQYVPWLLRQHH
jgi:hypothetical protein